VISQLNWESSESNLKGMSHISVLQKEVLRYLDPKPNQNFIDCTIGEAGHTLAICSPLAKKSSAELNILEKNRPKGKVLGIDWSSELIKSLEFKVKSLKLSRRLILVCDNFANLKEIVEREKFRPIQGILFDLGMSSWHLEESGRGFSFLRKEPLDMRYNSQNPLTAEKIVNYRSESEIEKILREYGEERFAGKIAREIIKERKAKPIKNTSQLIEVLKRAIPSRYQHRKIPRRKASGFLRGRHFATRTFQALRITVNDELNNLRKALHQTLEILEPGGRIVIISFHSLEDRIVKNFFRNRAKEESLKILTKKPITPREEEIKINPRSRSAKLRAARKVSS